MNTRMSDDSSVFIDINRCKQEEQRTYRCICILKAINSINQVIHSTLTFDVIMRKAMSEIAKTIECDTAVISLRNGELWKVSYVYGFSDDIIGMEMNDEEEPHAVLAIKTKKACRYQ